MQEADRAALTLALGMATDWVCRYARALGRCKGDKAPEYSVIASFAACHGEEQLRRFDELLREAAWTPPTCNPKVSRLCKPCGDYSPAGRGDTNSVRLGVH